MKEREINEIKTTRLPFLADSLHCTETDYVT